MSDLIDREHLLSEIAKLKESPWFKENYLGSKLVRKEAIEIVEDLCIKEEPAVRDRFEKFVSLYNGWHEENKLEYSEGEMIMYQYSEYISTKTLNEMIEYVIKGENNG